MTDFHPTASDRSRVIFERCTGGNTSYVDGVVRSLINGEDFVWIDDAVFEGGSPSFPLLLIATARVVSIAMSGEPT